MIGAIIQTGVINVAGLVAGRVVTGFGVGLISMLVPMYQAEAAPAHIRGSLVSFYQLSITIGILVGQVRPFPIPKHPGRLNNRFSQGIDLGTEKLRNSAAWRIPIGIQILWALMVIGGCAIIPESPRYLVTRGKIDEARRSLAKRTSLGTQRFRSPNKPPRSS